MTVTVYASTDTSAPTLTNANGSMNALLYACLVTGYGSKSGAGWARPFTGTDLAAFLQGAGGHGCYLRVLDGTSDGTGRRVNLRGYEDMTDVSTGTLPFPTTDQVSGGGPAMYYHFAGSPTPRPWVVVASSSFVHVISMTTDTPWWEYFSFGSFSSYKSGDAKPVVLMAAQSPTAQNGWPGTTKARGFNESSADGVYLARSDTGSSGAIFGSIENTENASAFGQGNATAYPYPDRVTNSLLMAKATLWSEGYRRGVVPGLWQCLHTQASIGGNGTTWSGAASGPLSGKQFTMFGPLAPYVSGAAYPVLELSDTWD